MGKTRQNAVNPFNRADFDRLKQAERLLHDTVELLDKCDSCGIDTETFRAVHGELAERLSNIEREFMSPVPKS